MQNDDDDEDDIVGDDASAFSSQLIEEASAITGIYDNLEDCPDNNQGTNNVNLDSEISANSDPLPQLIDNPASIQENLQNTSHEDNSTPNTNPLSPNNKNNEGNDDLPTIPKGRSITHPYFVNNKIVFLSSNIETGGEHCGILQLSAEIVRIDLEVKQNKNEESAVDNTVKDIRREPLTFNKYMNPGEGTVVADASTAIHGLHSRHPKILEAEEIYGVWSRFCS